VGRVEAGRKRYFGVEVGARGALLEVCGYRAGQVLAISDFE
jgi:hypothetical protein